MKGLKSIKLYFGLILLCIILLSVQTKKYTQHVIAFYNVENLFDTINDPKKFDEEYTPTSKLKWNTEKYKAKINNIAKAIRMIGSDQENPITPTLIGLSEVENRQVITDLIATDMLRPMGYEIIHFDSPDNRGIDVALLYKKKHFYPLHISKHGLVFNLPESKKSYTRDQLLVTGLLDKEEIHILINHWPSRSGGEKKSKPKRNAAAQLNRKIIDSLLHKNPKAKIITMGDFNDNPNDESIQQILNASGTKNTTDLYNPMHALATQKGLGSLAYRDVWCLFDQIIVSRSFLDGDYSGFQFRTVQIENASFLRQPEGRYKGYPLRNTPTKVGYSDHFPVYITLIRAVVD